LLRKGKKRTRLEAWFDAGVGRLNCLAWDAHTGLRWAQLVADLRGAGRVMPIKDSLIAATALVHDLTVVTRNRADFTHAGVRIIDPFAS
jgi:predicted nucleic acid-binding protein